MFATPARGASRQPVQSMAFLFLALLTLGSATASAQESPIATLQRDLPDNWGRWGTEDALGALNYLTEAQVLRGIAEVETGTVFTLQIPMEHGEGPVFPGRVPVRHYMTSDESLFASGKEPPSPGGMKGSDDAAFLYLQGTTHVDALAHAWYGDQVYGGQSAESTIHGHSHADISAIGERGVAGRGVLLDVGRALEEESTRLAPGRCITLADIRDTAQAQGLELQQGDMLLLRTGSMARYYDADAEHDWNAMTEPGLCHSKELVQWFHDMEIPLVAADNLAVELPVQEIAGEEITIPLHGALMRDLGVVFSEIYWLEQLAEDSAEDGRYSFLFVAAPLKMRGGSGSPVNPVVIK